MCTFMVAKSLRSGCTWPRPQGASCCSPALQVLTPRDTRTLGDNQPREALQASGGEQWLSRLSTPVRLCDEHVHWGACLPPQTPPPALSPRSLLRSSR